MRVGYVRSTKNQNMAEIDELFERFGVEKVYTDKVNSRYADQPELQKMIEYVRPGDIVVVESVNQVSQDSRDLLNLVKQLTAKDVHFMSQKEAFDTLTPTGKFVLAIFEAVAKLEQDYLDQKE